MAHRHLGWQRQELDPRDWQYLVGRRTLVAIPAKTDLTPFTGPYLNQADEGSCGPSTAAEHINYDQKVEGMAVVVPSRNFIYWNTRYLMGTVNQDSGVDNRTLMKALAQYGYCPETMWPYNTKSFTVRPNSACYQAALPNKITNYAAVQKQLDQMKGTIAQGRPFIFGFDVFQQIMSDQAAATGVIADPVAGASPVGGHDMLAVAYDDNGFGKISGGAFKLRQHWLNDDGGRWGDDGYGYISYPYATGAHASDFWVANAIPGGTTPMPTTTLMPTTTRSPSPPPLPPGLGKLIIGIVDDQFHKLELAYPRYQPLLDLINKDVDGLIIKYFPN